MNIFDVQMRLFDTSTYRHISNLNQINSHQPLMIQIDTESTQGGILSLELKQDMNMYLVEFLIHLDYCACVPFGGRGRKRLETLLEDKKISFIEYKKKAISRVLEEAGIAIKDGFYNFLNTNMQDLREPDSLAATVRLISSELDNLQSKGEIIGIDERNKKLEEILEEILAEANKNELKVDISKYLNLYIDEELNEEETKYFDSLVLSAD